MTSIALFITKQIHQDKQLHCHYKQEGQKLSQAQRLVNGYITWNLSHHWPKNLKCRQHTSNSFKIFGIIVMVIGKYLNGLTEIIFIAILVESECYSAPFQCRCTVEQMHLRRGTLYFVLAVKTTPVYRQNNQSCKLSTATRHQLDLHSILPNKPF